jgi:cyclohexanone monooxygenase
MNMAQAGFTASFPHILNEQAKHIAYIVKKSIDENVDTLEVTEQAEAEWVARCIAKTTMGADFFENCTPGYYNNEGNTSALSVQNGFYGGGSGSVEFISILEQWRKDDALGGMELRKVSI